MPIANTNTKLKNITTNYYNMVAKYNEPLIFICFSFLFFFETEHIDYRITTYITHQKHITFGLNT